MLFVARLCVMLGRFPGEVLARSADELAFLLAYAGMEPFGPVRDDFRAAQIVSAVFGSQGAKVAPGEVFNTLRVARPRAAGKAGPMVDLSEWRHLCPALTNVSAGSFRLPKG